jgi:rare lipoprotein A
LAPRSTRLRRLRIRRATHSVAVATGVLLIVGLAHVTLQKHVTLVVNGRPQAVSTTSASVHDLLMGEGISLTSAVLVTPPPATDLADGMTVVVSAAPSGSQPAVFTPVIPGSTGVGVWVVDGSSQELVGSSDSASSSGTSPVVSVRAVVSGKVHDVSTNAGTAGALLTAMGISPDANDRVQPPLSTPLHSGMTISAERVVIRTQLQATAIPYRTITTFSPKMTPGTRKVLAHGVSGDGRATYQLRVVDGTIRGRHLIARWIETPAVNERILAGPQPMGGGTTTRVPGAVGTTQTGLASWYDPPWSGLTAAHPSLPFGTRVTVTDLDTGRSVTVVIDDRGPFAKGKIIDLSPEAFQELAPLGRGVLHVQLSW